MGLGIAGMPPLITTVRPGEVMKAPESSLGFETSTGTGSGSAVEGIRGSHTTTRSMYPYSNVLGSALADLGSGDWERNQFIHT